MADWINDFFVEDVSDDELSEVDDVDFFATEDTDDEETTEEITFEDESGEVEEDEDNIEEEEEEENLGERLLEDWRNDHAEIMQSLDAKRAELQKTIDELKMQRGMR